ncbi:MAG TPA: carbohydrate-binding protein [Vicinamibacterales bacterium]|nr:carbohydrate-binding protein [Vicinamibacterales bacterium]
MIVLLGLLSTGPATAATLTVCASGCMYTSVQAAVDAASPGDTVLLRAGETFTGHLRLPVKTNTTGAYIVIRSDASDSSLPSASTRLIPLGKAGGNTDRRLLARLVGLGGQWKTTPVVSAEPGAHHYRLQFLDIDGVNQEGWGTLVSLGTNGSEQSTLSAVPWQIVLDRVYVHGHAVRGQQRCISLNGRQVDIFNSYITDCFNFAVDAQAIGGFNGPGPFRIINNYLEASSENVMFGGADPRIIGLVPSDIEIRRNHFYKPLAWRDPILKPPSQPRATAQSGGSLAAGTYYFKVVAIIEIAWDVAVSAPSTEVSATVGSNGAVALSWTGVSNADRYRVYAGNSTGGQSRYMETSGPTTSFLYTGSGQVQKTPASSGTRWNVKNLLELKNAQRVTVDGNVFEHSWAASQRGFAIVLTPRNQDGTAPWSVVRDVTISNNIVRHAASGISVLGQDYVNPSERTERITIRNNLFYDISPTWGETGDFIVMTQSPQDIVIDRNTIFHSGIIVLADDGQIPGFVFTNTVVPHNTYGIMGIGGGFGKDALASYFPGSIFRRNGIGGGNPAQYPADNYVLDLATFKAQFVNAAERDYRLVDGSDFKNAGTDGRDIGVDFGALSAVVNGVIGGIASPIPTSGSTGGGSGGGGGGGTGSPFGGTPRTLPGVFEAEDFDDGGEGVAYHDLTAENQGGLYRNTGVDIVASGDSNGGYALGWVKASEWLRYSVNVSAAGTYDIEVRVASSGYGGTFRLEVNGVDKTGPMSIPDTGGWERWQTIRKTGVSLTAGQQEWRLVMLTNATSTRGVGNINYVRLVAPASGGASGSISYTGSPVALPGVIQAENFDNGGSGIAYRDNSPGNAGGVYRATDVDIATTSDTNGGYTLGWVGAGEWLNYTVSVASAGTYDIELRVASAGAGGSLHLEVNGVDRTGPFVVPNTGGWQQWTTIRRRGVSLAAGSQVWRLVMDTNGSSTSAVGNINYIRAVASSSSPYLGTAVTLPGTIQAEDFDAGGSGAAYSDLTAGNEGGAYRSGNVDIASASDTGGGYTLGWVGAGEWLKYTVNVGASGTYDLEIRVASAGTGGTFYIEVDGVDRTGSISVPNTGGWQTWTTIRKTGVSLLAGPQVWRVVMSSNGASTAAVGNINWIRASRVQ